MAMTHGAGGASLCVAVAVGNGGTRRGKSSCYARMARMRTSKEVPKMLSLTKDMGVSDATTTLSWE